MAGFSQFYFYYLKKGPRIESQLYICQYYMITACIAKVTIMIILHGYEVGTQVEYNMKNYRFYYLRLIWVTPLTVILMNSYIYDYLINIWNKKKK